MSPSGLRLLLNSAAMGVLALAGGSAAQAADASLTPLDQQGAPAGVQLIDDSRLGCAPSLAAASSTNIQCAFDTATRGARIVARQDWDKGSIEAYATVVRATAGAITPDRLLVSPRNRTTESTDFILAGFKGSAFDGRVKFTSEFANTKRVVDDLIRRDWTLADGSNSGTSALLRVEAKLVDKPGIKWSMTGEMRSTSEDYAVGRFNALERYAAMPGTRLALSSKARVGEIGLSAGLEQLRTPYGESASRKAGIDLYGVSVRAVSRDSSASPLEGSSLLGSSTHSTSAYVDLDTGMLAMNLLPGLGELPFLIPTMVNFNYRSGETENRLATIDERFGRSSLGIDGTWETPIGETILSYWQDSRTGITAGSQSRSSETMRFAAVCRRSGRSVMISVFVRASTWICPRGDRDDLVSSGCRSCALA